MLHFELLAPDRPRPGAAVIVLLHGRGATEQDLAGLFPHLPGGSLLVLPRAPFPAAPWGYGPGWAWYRFLHSNRPEPESFAAAQGALDELCAELPARVPVEPGPLVLGGFSQGGTMSIAYALRHPGQAACVVNFSGFVADHPSVVVRPETVRGTAFFWGHGQMDPAIPFALAEEERAQLTAAGADLEARDYPIGHWIDPEELADAMRWLGPRLGDAEQRRPPGGPGGEASRAPF